MYIYRYLYIYIYIYNILCGDTFKLNKIFKLHILRSLSLRSSFFFQLFRLRLHQFLVFVEKDCLDYKFPAKGKVKQIILEIDLNTKVVR